MGELMKMPASIAALVCIVTVKLRETEFWLKLPHERSVLFGFFPERSEFWCIEHTPSFSLAHSLHTLTKFGLFFPSELLTGEILTGEALLETKAHLL